MILIRKKGADLRIEYNDGRVLDGKILLIAIANGCYCGGGVKGVPYCKLDDGLMDVSVVKDISRMCFLTLFPSYAKGTHMQKHKIQARKIIQYSKEKVLEDHCERRKPAALHGWRDNDPEDGGVFRRAGRFQVYCAGGTVEARSFQSYGDHGDNCCNPLDFHVYLLLFAEQNSGINKFKTPLESCQSGRSCSTRNAVSLTGPRVRIPDSPPK